MCSLFLGGLRSRRGRAGPDLSRGLALEPGAGVREKRLLDQFHERLEVAALVHRDGERLQHVEGLEAEGEPKLVLRALPRGRSDADQPSETRERQHRLEHPQPTVQPPDAAGEHGQLLLLLAQVGELALVHVRQPLGDVGGRGQQRRFEVFLDVSHLIRAELVQRAGGDGRSHLADEFLAGEEAGPEREEEALDLLGRDPAQLVHASVARHPAPQQPHQSSQC